MGEERWRSHRRQHRRQRRAGGRRPEQRSGRIAQLELRHGGFGAHLWSRRGWQLNIALGGGASSLGGGARQ